MNAQSWRATQNGKCHAQHTYKVKTFSTFGSNHSFFKFYPLERVSLLGKIGQVSSISLPEILLIAAEYFVITIRLKECLRHVLAVHRSIFLYSWQWEAVRAASAGCNVDTVQFSPDIYFREIIMYICLRYKYNSSVNFKLK